MSSMDLYMSDSGSTSCQQASSVKTLENKAEQNETKKPTEMLAELLLRFGYSLQHIHTDWLIDWSLLSTHNKTYMYIHENTL